MKIQKLSFLLIIFLISSALADAQARIYVSPGYGYRQRFRRPPVRVKPRRETYPKFEPTVNLSFGYGFPNIDKEELVEFTGLQKGNVSQTGPITGALDYRFSRTMSIGVLVTHGKVSVPYYDYFTGAETYKGSLDNWAFMLNLVRYIPVPTSKVTPYIRTAIGVNSWQQNYTAINGSKRNDIPVPSDLAYQVGLGADFNLSKNAGIFIEAGYGKYILHGGLKFKF